MSDAQCVQFLQWALPEEPYTLTIIWKLKLAAQFPALTLRILATDIHPAMLARAHCARFSAGSLRELPDRWRAAAFVRQDGLYRLREPYKEAVTVDSHDIRSGPPDGPFDLILCRNLVFTYFEQALQRAIGERLARSLQPGGALVLGAHEQLPAGIGGFAPWDDRRGIYRCPAVAPES